MDVIIRGAAALFGLLILWLWGLRNAHLVMARG